MDFPQMQSIQQAADQSLATALYQQHAQAVFLYLRRHLLSREDAEDLLLEIFLCAVEKQTLLEFSAQYMKYVAPYQGQGIAPTPGPQRTPTPGPTASVPPTPGSTAPSVPTSGDFSVMYNQTAMSKVELYWNGHLAATLFLAVKSKV